MVRGLLGSQSEHWEGWPGGVPVVLQVAMGGEIQPGVKHTVLKWNRDTGFICARPLLQQWSGYSVQQWVLAHAGSYPAQQPDDRPDSYPAAQRARLLMHISVVDSGQDGGQ